MRNGISILSIVFLFLLPEGLKAQETKQTLVFKEGLYHSFKEFQNNNPSDFRDYSLLAPKEVDAYAKEGRLTTSFYSSGQFIWLGEFDEEGQFKRLDPGEIWALVTDSMVLVKHSAHLFELSVIGAICYFSSADALFYDTDPTKKQDFIFEMKKGKIKRFTRSNLLGILANDMELYQKFLQEERKQKMDDSLFRYLKEYNIRNPYSFPDR